MEALLYDDTEESIGDGESIDETDGTDHSSCVAEQQFKAFFAVFGQTPQNSSLQENQQQRKCQCGETLTITSYHQCDCESSIDYELESIYQLLLSDQNDFRLVLDLEEI